MPSCQGDRAGGMPRLLKAFVKLIFVCFLSVTTVSSISVRAAHAQTYQFSSVEIIGNQRVDGATIMSYAGIGRGQTVSAAELNDAYQNIVNSGLFEQVTLTPQGGKLVIEVVEYPTINVINFEGNKRLSDEDLSAIVQSQSRRVYSPRLIEADAANIVLAYEQSGRLAATVEPKIIRRSENRVDIAFEITEGQVVEVERISFVGNRTYSDSRLRRVLGTKQAGLLRRIVKSDTFIADRIEFDKQVLRDFYMSRGFVDFQILSVSPELTRNRDGFLITFNVQEGQQFKFGELTASTDLPDVDPLVYEKEIKVRSGDTYSPSVVDQTIARLERVAIREGRDFIRIDPRVTRNDRDLTLDVDFVVTKGDRIFVERIDIEGNATTLDRVIRRQFDTVEGDPFNPREIRETAERIRALGFFSKADVAAREGTTPDRVIVDVDVEEQPTGSLGFGLSYSVADGAGVNVNFSERNFLGRGQTLSFALAVGTDDQETRLNFIEPSLLGRDVAFRVSGYNVETDGLYGANFRSSEIGLSTGLTFPIGDYSRLGVSYGLRYTDMSNYTGTSGGLFSPVLTAEVAQGSYLDSELGYSYNYNTRDTGLDPTKGVYLNFDQFIGGVGGDRQYIETSALAVGEMAIMNEDVVLKAALEGGVLAMLGNDSSRTVDRFFSGGRIRGFTPTGIGPRDPVTGEALGGNMFAAARFEASFPLGLPEEYGIDGGLFLDLGSVWGLDNPGAVDDDFYLRSAIGFSVFLETPIGPLRLNFSDVLKKRPGDKVQNFDLTVSTEF